MVSRLRLRLLALSLSRGRDFPFRLRLDDDLGNGNGRELTTGKVASIDLTSTSALGGQNAEWIVEDFMENGALVPLANFGTVNFEDCVASTTGSQELAPGGSATVIEIENSEGVVLTGVGILSENVRVVYEG